LWLVPHVPVATVAFTSISVLTFPMARDEAKALDWVLQDSETMMFTVVQHAHFFPESKDEETHLSFSYGLYTGPPLTGIPMLDLLLLEALHDPTRNARYEIDAENCALIAQSLWLNVLPQIKKSAPIFRIKYTELGGGRKKFERLLGHKPNLILLPQFLSRVSNDSASGNALNHLLRIVHKYPLLEHNYDKSDGLSSLRKQVMTAAEKHLGAYSQVSERFYTM
jgi:hypothetical protein